MLLRIFCAIAASAVALTGPAQAEEPEIVEEVIVVAHPLSGEGLSQAATVIEGAELARVKDASIGSTLGKLPGIHNQSFGAAVGRPVIHGVSGPRVRVMEDRIDVMDVSVTSADHATMVEPFIAERVEVLKGPSTLLYGTGAIGGVVDVHTNRIPHETYDSIWGGIETRGNDNNEGTSTAAKLNGSVGQFSWHLDAAVRDGDEYEIPGFAESARQRAAEEAEHEEEEGEEEHEEEEEVRGEVPGSDYDSESFAGGFSYVGDRGFFGVAVSRIEADYGLPGGHGHEEEHEEGEEEEEEHEEEEEGNATLDLEQTRVDVEMGLTNPFGESNFTALNVRLGFNDYEHVEFEPNGESGTEFDNEAWELRTELVYEGDAYKGVLGLQLQDREFSAIGEEAFIAPVDTESRAVFWVSERQFDGFDIEGGLRFGRVEHDPSSGSGADFTTWAASLGAVIPMSENWTLGLVADAASRAPIAEELFSDGPHLVTNAYEIGDPSLDNERAINFSASLSHVSERWETNLVAYYTDYADFIYEVARGDELDGLPVFVWLQEDADFYGLDASVAVQVASWDGGELRARAQYDLVHAELDVSGESDIPRIPPDRFGVGFDLRQGPFSLIVDYLRASSQGDVAPGEFKTDAYDDLRAYLGFDWAVTEGTDLTVFLQGKNLTDDEQRLHTSFIKDFAPEPGRTIEAGIRVNF